MGKNKSILLETVSKYVYVIIGAEVLFLFITLIFFYLFNFAFPVYMDVNRAIGSLIPS